MKTSQENQETKQSHLHFQMWDKHLNRLNTLWSVEHHESIPHSESVVPEPSSLKEKILFRLKKFILRTVQPVVDQLSLRQDHMLDAQREYNAAVVQSLNGFVDLVDEDMKSVRQEVSDHLQRFQDHLDSIQSYIDNRVQQIEPRIDAFETVIWTFDRRKEALEIDHILLNNKFEQLLRALAKNEPGSPDTEKASLPEQGHDNDYRYLVFENLHRGDERDIKQRLKDYVQFYEGGKSVLDIGCARGEFLELLQEHAIKANGIDINQTMVEYCRKKGLHVEESDALSHLAALPDNSLDGIFVGHLVEHFTVEELQRFLHLCFAKLQSHKYLILETPNPQSLYTLSHHFYKDLSHRNPLDPEALLHLVKSAGFEDARIEPKNPFPAGMPRASLLKELDISPITDEQLRVRLDVLNQNIRQLNDIIYGYLDYAIITPKVRKF